MQKVSVVIPTYNYGRFIGEAIESVLKQTLPVFEVIVVDDGSSDNTEEVVTKFGERIKYIRQKNGGVGAARNTGIKNSAGDFIAFLDADDLWLPKKIEQQLQLFQTDGEIGLVTTAIREFDKYGNTLAEYVEGKNGWCAEDLLLFSPVAVGPGSTALVKRVVIDEVGGFDETKEMHPSEDWEFCYRVARKFKLAFIPEILVAYRNHGDNGHLKIPRFERAMLLAYEKTFRDDSPRVQKLKRQSYGNLHKVLAGSYFQARNYEGFLRNSVKSLYFTPANLSYFAAFPFRKLRRQSS